MHRLPPLPPLPDIDDDLPESDATLQLQVLPGVEGRLDKVLSTLIPEHSRGRIQGWIEAGHVAVNGRIETRVRHGVAAGDRLRVEPQPAPEAMAFVAEAMSLQVLAETADFVVLNKPVGLVVHPGAGNWQGTLLNGLLHRYPELRQVARAGIVHRLDKDTSGLLVVARTEVAQTALVRQLQARTVKREYVALVQGILTRQQSLDAAIGRDARVPVRMSAQRPVAAKPALTHVFPVAHGIYQGQDVTRVLCRLATGRTHQIRVHLSHAGFPLLGDDLYGGRSLGDARRQMLHAWRLGFDDPMSGEPRHFECELPDDMRAVVDAITWQDDASGDEATAGLDEASDES